MAVQNSSKGRSAHGCHACSFLDILSTHLEAALVLVFAGRERSANALSPFVSGHRLVPRTAAGPDAHLLHRVRQVVSNSPGGIRTLRSRRTYVVAICRRKHHA